jgi:hypothetical protein
MGNVDRTNKMGDFSNQISTDLQKVQRFRKVQIYMFQHSLEK